MEFGGKNEEKNRKRNGLKYQRIDPALRERLRNEWNVPVVWPALLVVVALGALSVPAFLGYRRRERMAGKVRA